MENNGERAPLSARDWHVLLALSTADLHGYGIMKAVEEDSGGRVRADLGSLYRILDRLLDEGLIAEADPPSDAPTETRGRRRRYYGLTREGHDALRSEAARLREALELATSRNLLSAPPR